MKCKYCDSELVEGKHFCPACGKDQDERAEVSGEEMIPEDTAALQMKEGIKVTPGKIALAIAAGVAVLALLVALVVSGIDGDLFKKTEDPADATSAAVETEPAETVPATIPPAGNPDDVTCKGSYSATNEEILEAADVVVATAGDRELTNGLLQAYYWDGIYAFLTNYGDYVSLLGVDLSQSLDTQLCTIGDVSMTWQQYFLQYALDNWHSHLAVGLEGASNGYTLSQDLLDQRTQIRQEMETMSVEYGYEDMDTFMNDYMAPGCSYKNYEEYMDLYFNCNGYLDYVYQNASADEAEVKAYYEANKQAYVDSGITEDAGKYADVRHILLKPEGGTTDENGNVTYSDSEWEACRQAAQDILDRWLAGDATEESFAELANTHSTDPGSNTNGGLYENVYAGQMVPAFNNWCFDESRVYGDYGLVQTEYGYHIMFFVNIEEIWLKTARADMISDQVSAILPAAMETYPMTVDYNAIKLSVVEFTSG